MSREAMQILLIEDNPGDAFLLMEALNDSCPTSRFTLTHEERLEDGLERLKTSNFDVALVDLSLPDAMGLQSIVRTCEAAPDLPILVLTSLNDETLAIDAVKQGAQDYLVKRELDGRATMRAMRYAIERKRLTTELERSRHQQIQLKDQFLSHVSHELRSPLTAIHQFVTIVFDGLAGKLNSDQREYLEIAIRNINQLRDMIGDLLDATRSQTLKQTLNPGCVSLVGLIPETVGMMEATALSKGVDIDVDLAGYLPSVNADPSRVRQILINLVDNAIKFTAKGGAIRVRADVSSEDSGFLQISVSDTGCGVSAEGVTQIFERHFQEANGIEASRKGLGLGLYLCKELVSRHGGRIWVESSLGSGSAFCFTLPAFSLETLIAPLVTNKRHGESIALIPVEVFPLMRASGKNTSKAVLQHAWDLLQACLVPDREMILPRIASIGDGEIFFVVASIEPGGEEELVRRIQEQGEHCQDFGGATIDLRVLTPVVESPGGHTKPLQPLAKDIAARIEGLLKMAV
jgi:signal transduction histidine kinase